MADRRTCCPRIKDRCICRLENAYSKMNRHCLIEKSEGITSKCVVAGEHVFNFGAEKKASDHQVSLRYLMVTGICTNLIIFVKCFDSCFAEQLRI